MSEMKEMILESAAKIFEKYSTKEVVNDAEKGQWAAELWENLEAYGMLGVGVPEELGGSGGDLDDALSILQMAGKYSAPIPLAETFIANWLLSDLGESCVEGIVTIPGQNSSEPFQLQKSGQGWIINGKAKYVPWARNAEKLLVPGESIDGTVLLVLPLEKAEIKPGKNMAGEARDEVIFDQVYIEECKTVSVDYSALTKKLYYAGALTRSVLMAGAIERVLDVTINHTNERSQFGRPIHRFQAIQHHLAALAGETAGAGIAAKYAVDSFGTNPFSKELAYAKIRINEAAGKVNTIAHQVLAAIGFTYEHTLHHSTRRLWSWREEFGTESDWEQVITEELLKLEKNELWSVITGVVNHAKKVGIQ